MDTLIELAEKYGTDKLQHGYMPFYEKYLPKQPKKLLEIGCLTGASIRMWRDYFPNTEIHCLDLFSQNPIPDIRGVKFHEGNQIDWQILYELRLENFDVIIDDGSHNSRDQMMTFFGLFNGNQYYMEDLHCCYESFYRDNLPYAATANELMYNDLAGITTIKDGNIILIYAD